MAISIRVRYFPPFNDLTGVTEEEFMVDAGFRVADLAKAISERHKKLREYLTVNDDEALRRHMLIVIDKSIARLQDYLADGNIVKLLPSIGGG